ncbi:MAG: sigma-70 family RNA polymerase sigma factor [Planctomycetes bacterium]|nr:sigma-70 family RNA polymerase sigma factor [Planctomycetota bacterium]
MSTEELARLVDAYAPRLVLYARALCASPEDVVQEALIALAAEPAPPADAKAWLYRAVRNAALNAARGARRRRRHEEEAGAHRQAWFTAAADDAIDAAEATAALAALPEAEREVVVLRLWNRMTFEQIAELTGSSDSTAQRRYAAAIQSLRERLGWSCPQQTPPMKT